MKSVHSVYSCIHLRCFMELSQKRRGCAAAHKRVSPSGLQSKASINCSQCMELFSSFRSDSSSALPLVRAFFSSLLICLLSRAKPKIQKKKETVLKPSVRARYTILQKTKKTKSRSKILLLGYKLENSFSANITVKLQIAEGKSQFKFL